MAVDIDTIVIGAGAVGLAIAKSIASAGRDVLVLEQHDSIGAEVSSRNSEVIHAGLYYPPGSKRAEFCVAGKHHLYAFCRENGVAFDACGKLLIATADDQIAKLKSIAATAEKNGVHDLTWLTAAEARALEPELSCIAAILSPSTGILDSHGFMVALEGHITSHGGQVVLETPVERIELQSSGLITCETGGSNPGRVTAKTVIVSAGLHASKLARTINFNARYVVPETYYAKGQYYALSGPSPFKRHIYPTPVGAWLGLHATVDLGGRCKFGPDIEWIPEIDYSFEPEKLTQFLDAIRSYYPALDVSKLHADYTGIRPKLYREGEPVPDFFIHDRRDHGVDGLVLLYGIESPGLTSSLAIGAHVAGLVT
jgi:L-2-hydroxyglutarate oxidase LhgO